MQICAGSGAALSHAGAARRDVPAGHRHRHWVLLTWGPLTGTLQIHINKIIIVWLRVHRGLSQSCGENILNLLKMQVMGNMTPKVCSQMSQDN